MGISYQFMENRVYSAEDVNTAFSRLVTKGVSFYKEPAALVSMEEAQANPPGNTVAERCALLNTDACLVKRTDSGYSVSPGTIYFENGASVRIGEAGYGLLVASGMEQYVYAQWNSVLDQAEIVVSPQAGPENCVALAKIAADGSVADWREFAKPRGIPKGGNVIQKEKINISFTGYDHDIDKVRAEIDLSYMNFNYILIHSSDENTGRIIKKLEGQKKTEYQRLPKSNLYVDLAFQRKNTSLLVYGKSSLTGNTSLDLIIV